MNLENIQARKKCVIEIKDAFLKVPLARVTIYIYREREMGDLIWEEGEDLLEAEQVIEEECLCVERRNVELRVVVVIMKRELNLSPLIWRENPKHFVVVVV